MFFQLWSHAHLYDDGEHAGMAVPSTAYPKDGRSLRGIAMSAIRRKKVDPEEVPAEPVEPEEEEVEEPKLNVVSAVLLLVVVTVVRPCFVHFVSNY